MHIDILIEQIRPHIPFTSEKEAKKFIDKFDENDRLAFVSALYFGRSHIHNNEINDDYIQYLQSGEMDRHWEKGNVQDNEIARILYEKNSNLTTYYDAFIRCTNNSNYDRSEY